MSIDTREFRNTLGQFATGVCVVCARNDSGQHLGLTINSFASVSLEPPLVLWSLQNDSDFYDLYAGAKHYSINVLAEPQQHLSQFYSKKGEHVMEADHFHCEGDEAATMHDTLATFHCRQHSAHEAGDHLIIIGEVTRFINSDVREPLLFHSGGYQTLANS